MPKLERRVAKHDRLKCIKCGKSIAKGEHLWRYRERALSYRDASNHGTWYPFRRLHINCK